MQIGLVVQMVALVAVANGTPLLAKKLLGDTLAQPLDGGALSSDGRPILGEAKTVRGVVFSLVVTALCSALIGLGITFVGLMFHHHRRYHEHLRTYGPAGTTSCHHVTT